MKFKKKYVWGGQSNIDTSSPTLGGPGNSFGNPGGASTMNNPMSNPGGSGTALNMTGQPGGMGTGVPQGGPPPTAYTDTLGTVNKGIGAATSAVSLADTIYETAKNKDPLYNQKLADSAEYNALYKKNYDHYNKQRSDIKTANATMQTVGGVASMFGPIGALVGGVVSLAGGVTNLAGNATIDSAEKKAQREAALKYGNSTLGANEFNRNMQSDSFSPYPDNTSQVRAYGGMIPSPPTQGLLKHKVVEYKGNTHANGGIAITPSDEVEKKEVGYTMDDGNKYIYSDKLIDKSGKSYAHLAKNLLRQIGK